MRTVMAVTEKVSNGIFEVSFGLCEWQRSEVTLFNEIQRRFFSRMYLMLLSTMCMCDTEISTQKLITIIVERHFPFP